jgi:hypothetical protein
MPADREAIVEFALKDLLVKGILDPRREEIQIAGTSIDRNLNQAEYDALCWFLDVHTAIDTNIGAASSQEAEYTDVTLRLPEPFLVFLDWVGRCQYPKRYSSAKGPPTKLQMARAMFVPSEEKYLRGGIDGYLQAIAQEIAHIRAERETLLQRRAAIREEYEKHRRKNLVSSKDRY